MGIFDKAKDLAAANPDKVRQIIDKAGDLVDDKTGGKYAEHVNKGQDLARQHLGAGQGTAPAAGTPAPGGAQPPADLPAEGAPVKDNPPA